MAVLHGQDLTQVKRIAVLRVSKEDWRRLMPVFLQRQAAELALALPQLTTSTANGHTDAYAKVIAALAGEMLQFEATAWTHGEYMAVPVCPSVSTPLGLFVGVNDGPMFRLGLLNP